MKDRGNVALPTDMVKVLKTQDENYVRTMRASGLKVCIFIDMELALMLLQKIDKIKAQLTALADLMKPGALGDESNEYEDELDPEDLETLKNAGIISGKSRKGKGRQPKHIVFVDDEEAGMYIFIRSSISR